MAKTNTTTDQIRQLDNKVHFAGALAELSDIKEGTTSTGIPYMSFSGAIQCGTEAIYTVRFRSFIKSKKSDGTDSKNYTKVKEWVKNAIPMTKNNTNPTMVDMVGSLVDNPYVASDGKLKEDVQFNVQLFGDFKEYAAEIDLEGFIHSFTDETKGVDGEELTGRKRMRLISRDIFSNTLDIKKIVIPKDLVRPLRDNDYEEGRTAKFYINLMPNETPAPVKTGGIGVTRATKGDNFLEWVLTGADSPIPEESEKALNIKLVKNAMNERKTRLAEITDAGYLGGNSSGSSSASSSSSRTGIGSVSAASVAKTSSPVTEDEDFPF